MGKKKKEKRLAAQYKSGLTASGGFSAPASPLYDFHSVLTEDSYELPTFHAQRGGISYRPTSMSQIRGGDHMGLSISRLAQVASLVAFGAAALGNVLFGHGGLELVSAGLFLHVGADVLEDVLAG